MRSGSGQAAPPAPAPQASPGEAGGGIGDILREIFKKDVPEAGAPGSSTSTPSSSQPQDGDIGGKLGPGPGYQIPVPSGQQGSADSNGQGMPGDVLGQIMRELEKAARERRLKPVVIGPVEIDVATLTRRYCRSWSTDIGRGHFWSNLARHPQRRGRPSAGAEARTSIGPDGWCWHGGLRRSIGAWTKG